jgi:hypothetical protein
LALLLLLLLLLWYLHQFALSGAMDHLQDLRLRRVDAGLVEERLQPLGFTDDGAAVGHHAAPYLVQLSVKRKQQQQPTGVREKWQKNKIECGEPTTSQTQLNENSLEWRQVKKRGKETTTTTTKKENK